MLTNKSTCVIRSVVRRTDSCRYRQEDPSPLSILTCDSWCQKWDRRALAGPIPVGHRVLLNQCAFTGRHKLSNHYGDTSYVVVRSKTDRNLYEIRPAHGGPSKWVNRKMLVVDPRPGEPAATIGSDCPPVVDTTVGDPESDTVLPPAAPCQIAPSDERVSSRIPVSHTVRRSSRVNRGIHSNPAHLPGH